MSGACTLSVGAARCQVMSASGATRATGRGLTTVVGDRPALKLGVVVAVVGSGPGVPSVGRGAALAVEVAGVRAVVRLETGHDTVNGGHRACARAMVAAVSVE